MTPRLPPLIGVAAIAVIDPTCARLLRHRRQGPGLAEQP
jgi:hypothetical protein